MEKITRIGAYGLVIENNRILLVGKKSGPYKGKLDLPGGGLEFGESPEETLRREFAEEVASGFTSAKLLYNLTFSQDTFYHIGLIYSIEGLHLLADRKPEDEFYWIELSQLDNIFLTPFANHAVKTL